MHTKSDENLGQFSWKKKKKKKNSKMYINTHDQRQRALIYFSFFITKIYNGKVVI